MAWIDIQILAPMGPPTEDGKVEMGAVAVSWNTDHIAALYKLPFEQTPMMVIADGSRVGLAIDFPSLQILVNSDPNFITMELTEGADCFVNPKLVQTLHGVELDKTALMWGPQSRLFVKGGITSIKAELSGKSKIEIAG